jgi:hypothetical protein
VSHRHPTAPKRRARGQAAIEAALTLPLLLFMVLGTLQLFLLMQARIMAQYAAFQATRLGSLSQGACEPMLHAALLSLLPAYQTFLRPGNVPAAGTALGDAFGPRRDNHYGGYQPAGAPSAWESDEAIVWLLRERPTAAQIDANRDRHIKHFDQPLDSGEPVRLEVRLIFWAPLRIPFADWVFARLALAHFGLLDYTAQNPLLLTETANWTPPSGGFSPNALVANELLRRVQLGHYVFPIETSYTMRMMTPVRRSAFDRPGCGATPDGLMP